MFRWIVGTSLKFRYLVMGLAAVMVVYGIDSIEQMPLDVFPEFAPPRVQIQTMGPGLSAVEAEELITVPLEQALKGTPHLVHLRSKTVTGLSSITLLFDPDTDLLDARQLVQERLRTVSPHLPVPNVAPVVLPPMSAVSRAMQIGLSSKTMSMEDLSQTAFWDIRFRLLNVRGVANVVIWGWRTKRLLVMLKPERMRAYGVTIEQLKTITSGASSLGLLKYANTATGAVDGLIETSNQRLMINHKIPIVSDKQLREVVVKKMPDGTVVRMKDVARVAFTKGKLPGESVIRGGPGLLLTVEKYPWTNTLEVTRGLDKALAELKPGLHGIDIFTNFRPATFVEQSIGNLAHAMIVGGILVIVVLFAFLFNFRVALISIIAIPLSIVAAGLVLYWQNTSINTMILAGFFVGLGSVVDDAIIDIENILRRLRLNRELPAAKHLSTARVVLEASLEVRRPIVYATLIIVLSVMPIFFIHGLMGAFFQPLALAYTLALLASMVVALTVTPALALILLNNDKALHEQEPPTVAWLKRHYKVILQRSMTTPSVAILATIVVMLVGIIVWPLLGQSFMPEFKERDVLIKWVEKPGASRQTMYHSTARLARELARLPGLNDTFGSHIGRAITGPEVVGMNYGEHWISIAANADYDKTRTAVDKIVAGYPGIARGVHTYIRERIKDVIAGSSEAIVVRIFGPSLSGLRANAAKVRAALFDIEGLQRLKVEQQVQSPQARVKVNIAAAAHYGLKPGDVRRAVGVLMASTDVSDIFLDGRNYGVFVWSVPEVRRSLNDMRNFLLDTPDGGHVRLGEIADVRIRPAQGSIKREGSSRRIDVSANLTGTRDLGSVVRDVRKRLAEIEFPLGYRAELLGEFQEREAVQKRLRWITLAAVIGIFLLLQVSFGSWRLASLTFLAMPSALVGGVLAASLGNPVISLGSLVGFLTVLGIAARNGILLIHHYQHLQAKEGMAFGPDLVLRGAGERLSPILMTSLSTMLALLPLAISGNLPGHEIEHPMAMVIVGGLITSTLLNLFVVPLLYLWFGGSEEQSKSRHQDQQDRDRAAKADALRA